MNGLEPSLLLSKGAFVMLTMNTWTAVGLCNGSTGKIGDIEWYMKCFIYWTADFDFDLDVIYYPLHQPPDLPIAVTVRFDNYIGPSISTEIPSLVLIVSVTVSAPSTNLVHERQ